MSSSVPSRISRLCLVLGILAGTIGIDQITKVIARQSLSYPVLSYVWDTVRFQHTENAGAFLSLGAEIDGQTRFWVFTVGVALFMAAALWVLLRKTTMPLSTTVALTLVVGGGIGNLIDRAMKGTVTDFMNVGIGWLRTGIFNVADMVIMLGVAVLIFQSFKKPESSS
jgi:signal peptidase II